MTRTTTGSGTPLETLDLELPPMHIPDGSGRAFKTELVLRRTQEETIKLLWWHSDDPREEPHDHPWEFTSEILAGGYSEDKYHLDSVGVLVHTEHTYREGDGNLMPLGWFHNVRDVLPGTRTRMVCGPARPGNEWGYILVDDPDHPILPFDDARFATDPTFVEQIRAMNPIIGSGD